MLGTIYSMPSPLDVIVLVQPASPAVIRPSTQAPPNSNPPALGVVALPLATEADVPDAVAVTSTDPMPENS